MMKPFPIAFLAFFGMALPAAGTVSIEFQLGAVDVPTGSLGVLVADTGGNGFHNPATAPGVPLSAGSYIGADDVVVAVFPTLAMAEWAGRRGFSAQPEVIDYGVLGVAPGQAMVLYVFPLRSPGNPLRSGEPHLAYRTAEPVHFTENSSMDFSLPEDGGAYTLGALGPAQSGMADLSSIDIAPLSIVNGSGSAQRGIAPGASHTLFLELSNATKVSLSNAAPAGIRTELRNANGELVASSDGSGGFAFEGELAAGFHTLVVSRQAGGGGSLFYQVELGSASAPATPPRPDVSVGPSLSSLRGTGVYTSPAGQKTVLTSRKAKRVTGYATVANRSPLADRLKVSAGRGTSLFKVSYQGARGNLTADLTSGLFRTREIDENSGSEWIRATVTPNKKKLVKKRGRRSIVQKRTFTSLIRATSALDPRIGDSGQIQVKTR